MGRDKALLELAGRPLIAHAVGKLRRVTGEATILAGEAPGNPALAEYAPLVFDLHPGCGPMSGIEAALAHSRHDWNLILPVDVPFLPAAFLAWWVDLILLRQQSPVAFFRVDGVPQPALLLVHREVGQFLTDAIGQGAYKLRPVLEDAARQLAPAGAPASKAVPYVLPVDEQTRFGNWEVPSAGAKTWQFLTDSQRHAQPLWFSNLNTPGELSSAAEHADALDPLC